MTENSGKPKFSIKRYLSLIISGTWFTALIFTGYTNCAKVDFETRSVETERVVAVQDVEVAGVVTHKVTETYNVLLEQSRKVDVVLILDSSASMIDENTEMGAKLDSLLGYLEDLDWRLGITTTEISSVSANPAVNGAFAPITVTDVGTFDYVENSTGGDLLKAVQSTIASLALSTDGDERGIFAANLAIQKNDEHGFFRKGAHVIFIIVSDEDERSNDRANLESMDQPQTLIDNVKAIINPITFTVHTVITVPGDIECLNKNGFYFGEIYKNLSELTGGQIKSICDARYDTHLEVIGQSIIGNLDTIDLYYTPIEGTLNVQRTSDGGGEVDYTLTDKKVSIKNLNRSGTYEFKYDTIDPTCCVKHLGTGDL